jgi:hypothetical protein
MEKDLFAKRHGFSSFDQMRLQSTTVIFDEGINYIVTETPQYFLAWIENYPDYPLGRYKTFSEAQSFLIAAFEQAEAEALIDIDIPARLVSVFGDNQGDIK